eukprot:14912686-Alexandrium_andersonii.AAC.1
MERATHLRMLGGLLLLIVQCTEGSAGGAPDARPDAGYIWTWKTTATVRRATGTGGRRQP